jgi:hypothetical protein
MEEKEMNRSFNASRFGKYFVHDIKSMKDNAGGLLIMGVVSALILFFITRLFYASSEGNILFMFTDAVKGPSDAARIALFVIMTAIFTIILPAKTYGSITSKAQGTAWLMLPASRLEKYISMLLCCLVIAPVIFLASFLLTDAAICLIDPSCGKTIASTLLLSDDCFQLHALTSSGASVNAPLFAISAIVQTLSVFLLGALLIKNRKWKVVGTVLALFALQILLVTILATLASNGFFNHMQWFENWMKSHMWMFDRLFNIFANCITILIVGGSALICWFKIKKIQL